MEPQIIREKISTEDLARIVRENFGMMTKVDVDIKRRVLTIGGEWHSEGDEILHEDGSLREDVWGINFYPWNEQEKRIEYTSLINIKPALGHRAMEVKNQTLRADIRSVVEELLLGSEETLNDVSR